MKLKSLNLVIGLLTTIFISSSGFSAAYGLGFEPWQDEPFETINYLSDNVGEQEHLTKPTFGKSYDSGEIVVDAGFTLNNQTFSIIDNFHTPFEEQSIILGEFNSFESKVYSPKGLKVQEFLFGIPTIGEAHLSELGLEVWYNHNEEIENVKVIQKSNVIDKDSLVVTHKKSKCKPSDVEEKCDTTNISVMFLEPLKDKVMALKAIDHKKRYQITYLNEGFDISDASMNPMQSTLIPSPVKGEGALEVTQSEKYSPYWITDDGRTFERNTFGSFKQINILVERSQDLGVPLTRYHSGFGEIINYEKERALNIFNATTILSELPASFDYDFPESDQRISDEMKRKMIEQEMIAQKILEDSQVQVRYSKHSRS